MQMTNEELNKRLTQYKNECGCSLGARFMLAAFAASAIFVIRQYGILSMGFLTHVPLVVVTPILAAGVGKAIGILYARYRYKQLLKQLALSQSI